MWPVGVVKRDTRHIHSKWAIAVNADFVLVIVGWQLLFGKHAEIASNEGSKTEKYKLA